MQIHPSRTLPSYVYTSPENADLYAAATQSGTYDLTKAEARWRDRQSYLEARGYTLRPRYHAGWSPSWIGKPFDPTFCEDSILLSLPHIIDAVRQRDGCLVSIKTTKKDNSEIHIAQFLQSIRELDNHCVPVIEVFPDPLDTAKSLMVMPFLRPFDDPEFRAIGEAIDFMSQVLEGLVFIHRHGVAHRDIAPQNVMMDGSPLYPEAHHPVRLNYSADAIYELTPLARIDRPVKYFFIDFGISTRFEPGASPLVLGERGREKDVPELSNTVPYDAYKVDIFALGSLFHKEFLEKYYGLEFLQPLVENMRQRTPSSRPTAEAALAMFRSLQSRTSTSQLRWRLRSRTETAPERVVYDTFAVAREGIYQLKRLIK